MKKMVVIGGGISGLGAARLGAQLGYSVFLSDSRTISEGDKRSLREWGVEFEEGGHGERAWDSPDLAVKSPGVPNDAPVVTKLVEAGCRPISEIEFAARHTDAKIAAVSGTNGKPRPCPCWPTFWKRPDMTMPSAATWE